MTTNTRKAPTKQPKSKDVKSADSLPFLLERVQELEKRVAELEKGDHFEFPAPPKPKPGPKPSIRLDDLLQRRDALIHWLEDNWPELRRAIRRADKAEHLIPALRRAKGIGSYEWQPPFYTEWKQYWPLMWEFTQTKRYRNNPRNIANAMAGIPEISWKRSFDLCSSHPSHLEIQKRAVLDYLQRKVPERLKAIRRADGDTEQIREILQKRTKDRQLHILGHQAEYIPRYLEEGEPRSATTRHS
jgi:hypothetical protein